MSRKIDNYGRYWKGRQAGMAVPARISVSRWWPVVDDVVASCQSRAYSVKHIRCLDVVVVSLTTANSQAALIQISVMSKTPIEHRAQRHNISARWPGWWAVSPNDIQNRGGRTKRGSEVRQTCRCRHGATTEIARLGSQAPPPVVDPCMEIYLPLKHGYITLSNAISLRLVVSAWCPDRKTPSTELKLYFLLGPWLAEGAIAQEYISALSGNGLNDWERWHSIHINQLSSSLDWSCSRSNNVNDTIKTGGCQGRRGCPSPGDNPLEQV